VKARAGSPEVPYSTVELYPKEEERDTSEAPSCCPRVEGDCQIWLPGLAQASLAVISTCIMQFLTAVRQGSLIHNIKSID